MPTERAPPTAARPPALGHDLGLHRPDALSDAATWEASAETGSRRRVMQPLVPMRDDIDSDEASTLTPFPSASSLRAQPEGTSSIHARGVIARPTMRSCDDLKPLRREITPPASQIQRPETTPPSSTPSTQPGPVSLLR
jgi:hypothetical protein